MALAGRRAGPIDDADRAADERRGELARVPDGRRAAHDDRVAAVVGADPEQSPEHVRDVPAEHAAIGVQLVDDDVAQLLEQQEPLGVVGQDRRAQHVRVGRHDLARAPDGRPDRRRRVPVVGRRGDRAGRPPATARRTRSPGPGRAPWSGTGGAPAMPGRPRAPAGSAARSTASCPTRSGSRPRGPRRHEPPRSPPPGGCTAVRCRAPPGRPRSVDRARTGTHRRRPAVVAAPRGGRRHGPWTARTAGRPGRRRPRRGRRCASMASRTNGCSKRRESSRPSGWLVTGVLSHVSSVRWAGRAASGRTGDGVTDRHHALRPDRGAVRVDLRRLPAGHAHPAR